MTCLTSRLSRAVPLGGSDGSAVAVGGWRTSAPAAGDARKTGEIYQEQDKTLLLGMLRSRLSSLRSKPEINR